MTCDSLASLIINQSMHASDSSTSLSINMHLMARGSNNKLHELRPAATTTKVAMQQHDLASSQVRTADIIQYSGCILRAQIAYLKMTQVHATAKRSAGSAWFALPGTTERHFAERDFTQITHTSRCCPDYRQAYRPLSSTDTLACQALSVYDHRGCHSLRQTDQNSRCCSLRCRGVRAFHCN